MVLDVEPSTGSLCLQRLAAETNRASPKDVTISTAPKSRTVSGDSPQREMTLDYLFLAIETILCSQGSFRRDLGI